MTVRYKSQSRSRCYQFFVSNQTPLMSSINTHFAQSSAQRASQCKYPARTSGGHKTSVSNHAELLTGDLRTVGTCESFRTVLNDACMSVEPEPGNSRSQGIRIELERQVAALRAG